MDPITERMEARFGSFPEPVLYLSGGRVIYANAPGERLRKQGAFTTELLLALAEHPDGSMEIALEEELYRVSVSPFDDGDLLVLRPMAPPEEGTHPFSFAVYRMQECLQGLFVNLEKLWTRLEKDGLLETYLQEISVQNRQAYQILRLTRQAELNQELDDQTFPREEGFDLAEVCLGMADEAAMLADLAGVRFTYSANVEHLAFQASKSLITHMILALVSNAVRAAGRGGSAGMKLRAEGQRLIITVKDSGTGFPEERLAKLFSGRAPNEIPWTGEGAGLGLYNARRIALLHGGTLVVQSGQEGGTAVVVSLPIVIPDSVPARNNPGYDNLGGFSPVRIELSDVLPWQAYVPSLEDE